MLLFLGNSNAFGQDQPTVQFTTNAVTVNQSDGYVLLTAQLSAPTLNGAWVQAATQPGTATSPDQFIASAGTLVYCGLNPGDPVRAENITATFYVALGTGTPVGTTTSFTVVLSDPDGAIPGTNSTVTVTITNGPPQVVQFTAASLTVNESDHKAHIYVTLTGAPGVEYGPVTVNYATSDGTAIAGTDYTATSGTVTFPAVATFQTGSARKKIHVGIIVNGNYTNQTVSFTVTLSSPSSNAVLGSPATIVVNILDDDPPPSVLAHVTVRANGGTFTPDPAPIGTWVKRKMTARATRPPNRYGRTVGAPAWNWTVASSQYSDVPDSGPWSDGSAYADPQIVVLGPLPPDGRLNRSEITLYANFTAAAYWQVNVKAQVDYTDSQGGTYEGTALAQAEGMEWNVDKIVRRINGTEDYVPIQGVKKWTLPGSLIYLEARVTPAAAAADLKFKWDQPPGVVFQSYTMENEKAVLTPVDAKGKLINIPESDRENKVLKFYWADTGTKTVKCTVKGAGRWAAGVKFLTAELIVDKPTVAPAYSAKIGKVGFLGLNDDRFGLRWVNEEGGG